MTMTMAEPIERNEAEVTSAPAAEMVLVDRARGGDLKAYDELVRRYQERIYATVYHMTANHEDANDLAQESFVKAFQALKSFKGGSSFYTWLYRIVTNVCLDQLRRRQARPEDQAPESNSGNHEEGIPDFFERQREHRPTLDPERQLFGKEIQARIVSAMERLSPRERIVFELKHYQGLKLRAIGDALGTTEETVKNSLFRATRKLRSQLGGLR